MVKHLVEGSRGVFFQIGKRGYGSLTHDGSMGLMVNIADKYTIVPWILWVMMEIGKFGGLCDIRTSMIMEDILELNLGGHLTQ